MNKKDHLYFPFLFLCFSVFLGIQIFEVYLHPDVTDYYELWLALSFTTIVAFVTFFVPVLTLEFLFMGLWQKLRRRESRSFVRILFLLGLGSVVFVQDSLLDHVYYTPSAIYWVFIGGAVFVAWILSWFKWTRIAISLSGILFVVVLFLFQFKQVYTPRGSEIQGQKPNVLVVFVDTLRRDHTSFNGYSRNTTPFLSKLAEDSVVFDNAISTSSWTKPSMAAYFSGRYLLNDTVHIRTQPISHKGTRLPQVFRNQGYETAFFSANPNTGSYYRGAKGFKHIVQPKPASHFPFYDFVLPRFFKYASNLPKRIQFNNNVERLKWFQHELNVIGINALKDVANSPQKQDWKAYQRQLKPLLSDHEHLKKAVDLPHPMIKAILYPLSEYIFENALKWSFISPSLSSGEVVVDHWLADFELVAKFRDWYENQREKDRPFFAHFQFMGPHNPYQEQPPYLKPHFDPDSEYDIEMPPAKHLLPSQGAPVLPERQLYNMVSNYDDAIRITDANIRKLIRYLDRKGELKNTIVVFVSDHGESFYEHKIYDHMYSLYAELVNVPLFVYWRDHLQPNKTSVPVTLVDLYPTLIELAGLKNTTKEMQEGKALLSQSGGILETERENRVRYGAVWLGMKPPSLRFLKNQFDPWSKPGHQALQGFHRMVVKGNDKWVHEIEGLSIFGDQAEIQERVFHFHLDQPSEPLVPVNPDDAQFKEMESLFRPLPENIKSNLF